MGVIFSCCLLLAAGCYIAVRHSGKAVDLPFDSEARGRGELLRRSIWWVQLMLATVFVTGPAGAAGGSSRRGRP